MAGGAQLVRRRRRMDGERDWAAARRARLVVLAVRLLGRRDAVGRHDRRAEHGRRE